VPGADDDLEPIPLPTTTTPPPPTADRHPTTPPTPVVRDRFLVALAIVVALAMIALAVQLRSIARDVGHEAECSEALVAIVSSGGPNGDERDAIEAQVRACLGPDVTLPGFGRG
jgi:hypothetical protein